MEGDLRQPALSDRLNALVEQELEPGEGIRWMGQPLATHFLRRSFPFVLFGMCWTTFAVFLVARLAQFRIPQFNPGGDLRSLIGLPFLLIGVGFMSWPLWFVRKAQRTVYVVTERRAILFEGGIRSTTITSLSIDRLQNLRRVQRDDGSGDLMFDQSSWNDAQGVPHQTNAAFFAIPNVKQVEELIREIVSEG